MNLKRTALIVAALTVAPSNVAPAGAHHVTRDQVAARIMATFGPTAGPRAVRVARCESGLDPHAVGRNRNGTIDVGVFQLNSGGTLQGLGLTVASAKNWEANIAAAHRLYRQRGWQPWICSGRGR